MASSSYWHVLHLMSKPFLPYLTFKSQICNLILTTSIIVSILLSFMYSFFPHWSLYTVWYFILPVISSIILFLPLISFSPFFLFPMSIFACLLLYLFQSPGFGLPVVLFCKKCSCNSFFFLFSYHHLDFLIFINVLYVMAQHQCCIVYYLFCRPQSCFHQYPCVCCTHC